jgi:hypothetical protein
MSPREVMQERKRSDRCVASRYFGGNAVTEENKTFSERAVPVTGFVCADDDDAVSPSGRMKYCVVPERIDWPPRVRMGLQAKGGGKVWGRLREGSFRR